MTRDADSSREIDFIAELRPFAAMKPSLDSFHYKKAFEVGTTTLSSLFDFIMKDATESSLMLEVHHCINFFYPLCHLLSIKQRSVRRILVDAYHGIQRSVAVFALHEKLTKAKHPHTKLIITQLHKIIQALVDLPTTKSVEWSSVQRNLGQLLIEYVTKLKKLT